VTVRGTTMARARGSVWSFLDLTPLGRQEEWEDSPERCPQDPPYSRWRLHDEYEDAAGGDDAPTPRNGGERHGRTQGRNARGVAADRLKLLEAKKDLARRSDELARYR
jgi:predicted dithiol-disulfide oxidoreductase (DUF899 family)